MITEAVESSAAGSTFDTLPTSTPAIRTGEFTPMALVSLNTALISVPRVNGMSLANAK